MRRTALMTAAVVLAIAAGCAGAATTPSKVGVRPIVVVFETEKGEGVDKPLASSATRAICVYLRDTKRVDAIVFDRESPTVLRAIMDKQITADQVASYSSQAERITVAKALGYDYAAGADMSVKNSMIDFKLWLAKADGGKKDSWEAKTLSEIGGGANNYDNAVQSAASAAVLDVTRKGLAGLPSVTQVSPATGAETTAIKPELAAPPIAPGAMEYVAQADASLKSGNIAIAIQQYQQAVNADPSNPDIRLKLAVAFALKGMYPQATATLSRAALLGAAPDRVEAVQKQIDALQTGKRANRVEPVRVEPRTSDSATAAGQTAKAKSAVSRIIEGDKLWRDNKPDEAADAYKEAIKLSPSDWRPYERLALVAASVSMFADSRATLEQLKKVQPEPDADTIARRYNLLSTIVTQWLTALLKQYDDEYAAFSKRTMTRESYYESVKGLSGRLESMAKFLDAIDVPADSRTANLHRSLACGLVSQAASSLQEFLETNNKESKSSAETFVAQAKKELATVRVLEAGKQTSTKQPSTASAQTTTAQPTVDDNATALPQPDAGGASELPSEPPADEEPGTEAPGPPEDNLPGPPSRPAPPPRGPGGPPPILPPGVEIL